MSNVIKTTWVDVPPEVTLVAVTKTFPFEMITMAHAMGLRHVGENRLNEGTEKIKQAKALGLSDITWHMIGHVQSRKVRDVVAFFDWVDSVDSLALAQKLSQEAQKAKKTIHILLEVNIGGEESKFGFPLATWETNVSVLEKFIREVQEVVNLPCLVTKGLMTMAPYSSNPEGNRLVFQSMKKLSETIRVQIPQFGSELSMGTSGDYRIAIQEGATQVRLGEALFGSRNVAKHPAKQV
jgi:pyridoxal phosphate enzyme (YggS family)